MEEETKRKNQRTEKRQEKKRDIEEKERSRNRGGGMKEGTREKYIEQKRREDICRYEM